MSIEDDILIEYYLRDKLSEEDKKAFFDRLSSDAEFKVQFELEEQLFNALNEDKWSFSDTGSKQAKEYERILQSKELQSLKKTLADINTSFDASSPKSLKSKNIYYFLAAALIIIFLGIQFLFDRGISNQELYDEFIQLNDLPSFVSRSDDDNILPQAQVLFESKNYREALSIFEDQINTSELKSNILLYMGISQTELEEYSEAEKTFSDLINSDLLDAEKGYWYKALLYVKQDSVEEAIELLDKIVAKNLFNKDKAVKLLKALE